MKDSGFANLIERVRTGDEDAVRELVRTYEPEVRASIRKRLTRAPRLRRAFDSEDVWQSAVAEFFRRAAAGEFDLQSPESLAKLLSTIARNKFNNRAKAERAEKRDYQRATPLDSGKMQALADAGPTPSQELSAKELLAKFRNHLSPFECFLAEERKLDRTWEAIAEDVRGTATPEALRKRLNRVIDRVMRELGMKKEQA